MTQICFLQHNLKNLLPNHAFRPTHEKKDHASSHYCSVCDELPSTTQKGWASWSCLLQLRRASLVSLLANKAQTSTEVQGHRRHRLSHTHQFSSYKHIEFPTCPSPEGRVHSSETVLLLTVGRPLVGFLWVLNTDTQMSLLSSIQYCILKTDLILFNPAVFSSHKRCSIILSMEFFFLNLQLLNSYIQKASWELFLKCTTLQSKICVWTAGLFYSSPHSVSHRIPGRGFPRSRETLSILLFRNQLATLPLTFWQRLKTNWSDLPPTAEPCCSRSCVPAGAKDNTFTFY